MSNFRVSLVMTSCLALCAHAALADTGGVDAAKTEKEAKATRSLLIQNSLETNEPHMTACAALPKNQRIIDALRYANNSQSVALPGLAESLVALPAGLLRAAWCIPPRPSSGDMKSLGLWYHNFFEIPRYTDRQPVTYQTFHHKHDGLFGNALKAVSVGGGT